MNNNNASVFRLGYTESTLFMYFYNRVTMNIDTNTNVEFENRMMNYLYSTSGFYDKQIQGTYFDIDVASAKHSEVFNAYFQTLLNSILQWTGVVVLNIHNFDADWKEVFAHFVTFIAERNLNVKIVRHVWTTSYLYNSIKEKRVLIVNNLGKLYQQQYDSGTLHTIFPHFPKLISIQTFENGYTYFNNGPHNNILETAQQLMEQIEEETYDVVIVSAGAYSPLFASFFAQKKNKQVICVGGDLSNMFGVETRHVYLSTTNSHLFIPVPDDMKPEGYLRIENGAYW
jgi:hypothetical protein